MASLGASPRIFCSSSSSPIPRRETKVGYTQRLQAGDLSVPHLIDELKIKNGFHTMTTNPVLGYERSRTTTEEAVDPQVVEEFYAIMEAVADRVEMHRNIGEQRNNWNQLLLTSVNGMTFTAATMAGLAALSGSATADSLLALKFSSTLLYMAATGILMVMSKIQPSQLAEEQRNASRLFKQLHEELKTTVALKRVSKSSVKVAMEKVLALDKAFPLPLLGAMLDKFPKQVEPAFWWPKHLELEDQSQQTQSVRASREVSDNGWSEGLEEEMRKVLELVRKKDDAEYIKLSKTVLMVNKILAISGPLLTGLASVGSSLVGSSLGSWPVVVGIGFGALATVVNTLEHGGQVGMVFEMYRNSAGFFRLVEESIESALDEREAFRRENGEVFEAKVALELGRSVDELREIATSSRTSDAKEEFASKLF